MTLSHADLMWLPRAPSDFRTRCKALADSCDVSEIRRLASYALDINQLTRLARLMDGWTKQGSDLRPLAALKLAVVSNSTTSLIVPALTATGPRHGLALNVFEAPFDQVLNETVDRNSSLHRAKPDVVLVALDHRGLRLGSSPGDQGAAKRSVDDAISYIQAIRQGLHGAGIVAIFQTIAPPPEVVFGSLDRQVAGTQRSSIDSFNHQLANLLQGSPDILLDVAALAETVGLAAWHNPTQWALAKLPFAQELAPLYADHVVRLLGALRGKSRRCLVLDLDNTLWHGVIGDDGLEGIVIGQGNALGEAHLDLQRYAMQLRERGIVLAVASKNDDAVARRPFLEHPDMLLRLDHIAVFQANWTDKATNLIAIAEALSLGQDALVFVDDNPAERELIRQKLPDVAIPELPDDASLYTRTVAAAGYFEAVTFSADDSRRAEFYQDNARRLELQSTAGSIDDYLRSLEMTATFAEFDGVARARIAQLISKSNQFNLTTRRRTEAEVEMLERDAGMFTLQVRLADRFGDNGMISVVVCSKGDVAWEVDTWLMSCRVLKRRVEEAVLQEIVKQARAAGAKELRGRYLPTPRNAMVADHYESLGFTLVAREEDGSTEWVLRLDDYTPATLPMTIARAGISSTAGANGRRNPDVAAA